MLVKDYLEELLDSVVSNDERFRRSALAFTRSSVGEKTNPLGLLLQELLEEMKAALTDPSAVEAIHSQLLDELSLVGIPDCRGLSQGLQKPAFDEENERATFRTVTVRQSIVIDWERTQAGVKLRSHGQILEFAEPIASLVILLLEQGHLDADDMSSLDLQQRKAVVTRLCQENIVILE